MTLKSLTRRGFGAAIGALTVTVSLTASSVSAEGIRERAEGEGLRIAIFNGQPYSYVNENGDIVGTEVDTLKHVLGEMGTNIASIQAVEWGALIPGMKANRFDVVAAGMFIKPDRCQNVAFSVPTFGIAQSLVVPKGNPKGVENYDSIAEQGLKIATISGAAQNSYARDSGIEENNIMEVPDFSTAAATLKAGRVDVFAVSAPGSRVVAESDPDLFETVPTFTHVAGNLAMPHGALAFQEDVDPAFLKEFNEKLSEYIGSDEHVAMLESYGMRSDELPKQSKEELCAE